MRACYLLADDQQVAAAGGVGCYATAADPRHRMRQGNTAPAQHAAHKPARRYELDWLRTIVVLGLIPVHTASIFTPTADLYLKDTHTSATLVLVGVFGGAFGMPLLFFVSGAASWFILASRTNARYLKERVSRLLVPLIFATLAIIPIQVYVVVLSNPNLVSAIGAPISDPHFLDSYLQFYPQYLLSYAYFLGHPSVAGFIAFIGHLWFLLFLFVFSLLALPLFAFLKSPRGLRQIERLAGFCSYPGAIFTLAAPLALLDAIAHAIWTGTGFVAEIVLYLACFVYGYILYADPRFGQAMRRQWAPSLVAGAALWCLAELFLVQRSTRPYDNAMGSLFSAIPLRGIIAWFWIVGLIGFGITYLNRTTRLLRYSSEAAYPIYVLHVAAIVSVGYFVIRWDVPIIVKFVIIMVAALAIILGIYEALIKRVRILRRLFGLHGAPASASPPPESPAPLPATGAAT